MTVPLVLLHDRRRVVHFTIGLDATCRWGATLPFPRAVQGPELGAVVELPEVGGLHHRCVRKAA